MQEILTKFGAVIHIDPLDPRQIAMLQVAVSAFGGIVTREELTEDV